MSLSLILGADFLDFDDIFRSAWSKYKQLVYAEDWTPGLGSATMAAEPTLLAGYQDAFLTKPVAFHTMMCQDISTGVTSAMSASTQYTLSPPKGGGGRGGTGGNTKKVALFSNFNHCGESFHYVWYCTKQNMYWYPPPAGTEDTANKVYRKKGDKSYFTMTYCYVCKRWDYHNAPGHDAWQATQGGASGAGGHSEAAVAAVGGGEDSDDDFIPFIGWLIVQMFCYVIGDPVRQGIGWFFDSLATFLLGFMVKR